MRWIAVILLFLVAGCTSFQGRDDAIFIGKQSDIQYAPQVDSECTPGHICVGCGVQVGRFDEINVLEESGDRVRFSFHAAYHCPETGWIDRSAIAYPEDFQPVRDWKEQSHWNLCDKYGCMVFDINQYGHFTASYTDSCSIKDIKGKCPEYCPFSGAYDSPHCYDSGQVAKYRGIYQLQHKSGMLTYLLDVPGQGICWEESWHFFSSCQGPISWDNFDPKKVQE